MKYVKYLIPDSRQVDLSVYKTDLPKLSLKNNNKVNSFIALFFCLVGIYNLENRFVIGILMLIAASFIYYKTTNYIEQFFHFSLTKNVKKYFFVSIIIISIPFHFHYQHIQKIENEAKNIRDAQIAKELKEKQIKDEKIFIEANNFKHIADRALSEGKFKKALENYENSEKVNGIPSFDYEKGECYVGLSKYKLAIDFYKRSGNYDTYVKIGKCYEKLGDKVSALVNYKLSRTEESDRLYDKLNPIKRKVSYYQTVCCDGQDSPSNAKGRGACSHHGGVCEWNRPIYEEYREY